VRARQASKREIKLALDPQRVAVLLRSGVNGDTQAFDAAMVELHAVLEDATQVLASARAPARDAAALEAQSNLQRHLQELAHAVSARSTEPGSPSQRMAEAVAASLRFAFGQLETLKRDCANARLASLAPMIHSTNAGVECARGHFARRHGLDKNPDEGDVALRLPRTALMMGRDAAEAARAFDMPLRTARHATRTAPLAMHTGGARAAPSPPTKPLTDAEVLDGAAAVQPTSWQGLLRIGLLQIARHREPVNVDSLPETLTLDASRLFQCQELFQRLLVTAACLLLVARGGGEASAVSMATLAQRLDALLKDSALDLAALASEVAALAGTVEHTTARQLSRMLDRDGGECGPIERVVATAVATRLLGAGDAATLAALGRCGPAGHLLAPAVDALAAQLARLAVVNEAVYGPIYRALCT
jgi:hypothetical protein